MEAIGVVLSMLAAAIVSAILVRALPFAVPTPLDWAWCGDGVRLAPRGAAGSELLLPAISPPLLFLDGWRISKEGLLRDKSMILELALGLVFCTVFCMGF